MPQRNKSKRTYRRQNIVGNFRGSEDIFMTKVRDGFIKFLESPFKRYWWWVKKLSLVKKQGKVKVVVLNIVPKLALNVLRKNIEVKVNEVSS